jgi:diadenylate cyclase
MTGVLDNVRIADLADVLIITALVYWVINLIRGTRAVQMLVGLIAVGALYFASQYFELYTLSWILNNFLASSLVVIVILFQSDIRRALTRLGRASFFGGDRQRREEMLDELATAVATLSTRRIGAIIALEREVGLTEYTEGGKQLDAAVNKDLLVALFQKSSPIHDGAVVIRRGRIVAAACFLPLTSSPVVSKELGSRHRAAIGIAEETDAAVLVVSEERGQISLVREGIRTPDVEPKALREALVGLALP